MREVHNLYLRMTLAGSSCITMTIVITGTRLGTGSETTKRGHWDHPPRAFPQRPDPYISGEASTPQQRPSHRQTAPQLLCPATLRLQAASPCPCVQSISSVYSKSAIVLRIPSRKRKDRHFGVSQRGSECRHYASQTCVQ